MKIFMMYVGRYLVGTKVIFYGSLLIADMSMHRCTVHIHFIYTAEYLPV